MSVVLRKCFACIFWFEKLSIKYKVSYLSLCKNADSFVLSLMRKYILIFFLSLEFGFVVVLFPYFILHLLFAPCWLGHLTSLVNGQATFMGFLRLLKAQSQDGLAQAPNGKISWWNFPFSKWLQQNCQMKCPWNPSEKRLFQRLHLICPGL